MSVCTVSSLSLLPSPSSLLLVSPAPSLHHTQSSHAPLLLVSERVHTSHHTHLPHTSHTLHTSLPHTSHTHHFEEAEVTRLSAKTLELSLRKTPLKEYHTFPFSLYELALSSLFLDLALAQTTGCGLPSRVPSFPAATVRITTQHHAQVYDSPRFVRPSIHHQTCLISGLFDRHCRYSFS